MEFTEIHLFMIILLALFLYFISMYYETKEKIFGFIQFGISFPLTILLAGITFTNNILYGWILIFLTPILSLIILTDVLIYHKKKKK